MPVSLPGAFRLKPLTLAGSRETCSDSATKWSAPYDTVMSDVSERGNAAMEAAQDAASSIEETLEDAIQQRPIAAVGLAIGLGFLIGVTWRR